MSGSRPLFYSHSHNSAKRRQPAFAFFRGRSGCRVAVPGRSRFGSSVYSFSDGETCLKYRYRALKTDAIENPAVRRNPSIFLFFSASPHYHALNSCFLAQIRATGRILAAKSELPCPHFSAGERQPKYSGPGFGYNQESEVRIEPIYFLFFSVPQCLRGAKVLSLVAATSRRASVVQRSCH